MSELSRKRKKRGASLFGYGAQLICLTLVTSLSLGVRAEETPAVAQANQLASGNNAKDLGGAALAANASPGTIPTAAYIPPLVAQGTPVAAAAADEEPGDLLGEVNVTAQRRRTTERENSATTYVVKKEQIEALGALTVSDALKLVPGFNYADTLGGLASDTSNYLRGFSSQRFVFLIDGAPQSRASNNRADTLGTLPVTNIERIEVTLGGSTLRYGADAVTGVINIITSVPEGPPKVTLSTNFGSYGLSQYNFNYTGSNGVDPNKAGYLGYSLTYQRQSVLNDYNYTVRQEGLPTFCYNDDPGPCFSGGVAQTPDVVAGTFTRTAKLRGGYVFADFYYGKAIYKPGDNHKITFSIQQQNRKVGSAGNRNGCTLQPASFLTGPGVISGTRTPYAACFGTLSTGAASSNNYTASQRGYGDTDDTSTLYNIVWDWDLTALSSLRTQASYRTNFFSFANPGVQRYINNTNFDVSTRYTAELYKGNVFNAGFEFKAVRSTQGEGLPATQLIGGTGGTLRPAFYLDKELSSWAIYFTDDIKFLQDALIFNFGSRLTNNVAYGTFTVSGAGLRYNFGSPNAATAPFGIRANWQQSFKSPALSELYISGPIGTINAGSAFNNAAGNAQFKANPTLKPETAQGYEIGFDAQLSPSSLFRATYYRTDLTNAIFDGSVYVGIQPIPGTNAYAYTYQNVNAQAFLSTGWEFTYSWEADKNWTLNASHSIIDTRALGNAAGDVSVTPFPYSGGYFYEYQTTDVPNNTTGISIGYKTAGLTANLIGQILGPRPRENGFLNPSFNRWDITGRIPLSPSFTLTGGIFNIFNDQSVIGRRVRVSTGSVAVPGTTFRIGLEVTF